ncbi:BNR repeat domain protein [Vulgatibacter incomptus]|uniref:BNR repeat domain protein n=1 Tax=Vulgatibacter incomptus TaxID=1391653 RepID=A0A0K1P944_9BACT|nr:BNR repeat domain protein [Vulgatibacter incomptus]
MIEEPKCTEANPCVDSVRVEPEEASVLVGGTLKLTAFDADDRPIPAGRVTWTSSDPVVAAVDAEGRVAGVTPGVATIAAKAGSATASSRVVVEGPTVAAVEIQGASSVELVVGQRLQLAAIVRDATGMRLTDREVEWSSDAPNVVAIEGSAGFVRAVSPGSGNVTATVEGVSASVAVRVVAAPVASVRVNAAKSSIDIGEELELDVTVTNTRGEVLDREVRWSAVPEGRVSFEGAVVRGVRAGPAQLRAEVDGVVGTLPLTVIGHAASIAIEGAPRIDVDLGESLQLRAAVLDENGDAIEGKVPLWIANDPEIARVDLQGALVARKLGTLTVAASYGSAQARAEVRVGIPRFARLTGGEGSVCGITSDGRAFCWGSPHGSRYNESVRVLPDFRLESLTLGTIRPGGASSPLDTHYCGILVGGDAFCSGGNDFGVLGNGSTSPAFEPYIFEQAFNVMDSGLTHGCAIDQDHLAWCWGRGDFGQLGDGNTADRSAPWPVQTGLRFSSIHAARDGGATCAITSSGEAWCWGRNHSGALGNGTEQDSHIPVPVSGGIAFDSVSIVSGLPGSVVHNSLTSGHACGVSREGKGYCWGTNSWGQLGNGGVEPSSVPVEIAGGHSFRQIEISHSYRSEWDSTSCGLTTDGEVLCWGTGYNGELGRRCTSPVECEAVEARPVGGGLRFEELAVGGGTFCGLSGDGVAYCWGSFRQGVTWEPTPIWGQQRWLEGPAHLANTNQDLPGGE